MKNYTKKHLLKIALIVPLLIIAMSGFSNAAERWVDDNYTSGGGNDGHTWGDNAFSTIGAAVTASSSGDVITVKDGIYTGASNKNLEITKSITIQSENGPATAIVDCQSSGRGFFFNGPGASGSVLEAREAFPCGIFGPCMRLIRAKQFSDHFGTSGIATLWSVP